MKVEFLYRDASNYKASFTAEIVGKTYEVGDTELMENLGLVPEEFVPALFPISGGKWDEQDDHNILDVWSIPDEGIETDYIFEYKEVIPWNSQQEI
jgi:hypothetical protein